jgi:hypothetical protein
VSPFNHPAKFAKTVTVFGAAFCDHWLDAAFAKLLAMQLGIVAAIDIDDFGRLKRSTACTANRWNRVDKRQQLSDVVAVRAGQDCADRNAIGVYEDVVLGTGSRAIRGVRTRFSPTPMVRTDDEPTAAREKSSWPASRNFASSSSCSRSHTPALCQSRNRRQHVAPEPKPRLVGKWFQRSSVFNTLGSH